MAQPGKSAAGNALAGSAASYLAFAVETAVSLSISVLLVRTLSVEEFGAYKLAGAIILAGSYFTSCGLDATLSRFGAEFIARGQWRALARLLVAVRVVRTVALLVFCGTLLVMRDTVAELFAFPRILSDTLILVCAILVVQSSTGIWGFSYFAARGAFVEAGLLRMTVSLLKLGGFAVAFAIGAGLVGVLWALFAASAAAVVWAAVRNSRWLRHRRTAGGDGPRPADDTTGRILRFSLIGYLAINVNVFRDLSIDNFVIAHFLGAEQVALYGLAATLVTFANTLNPASLLRGVITPLLVTRYAVGQSMTEMQQAFRLLTKTVLLLHWPLLTLLIVLGAAVIRFVYTPEYAGAYAPLATLCAFGYFLGLTFPFVPLISVLEKNALLLLSGATSLYNLAMTIVLVPRFGITGAALATGSAAVLQLGLYWVAFRYLFAIRLSFPFGVLGRTLLNLTPAVVIALVVGDRIDGVGRLLGTIAAGAAVYCVMVYFNHGLDDRELQLLTRARGGTGEAVG